ncbi:MAG: methylmalonyl-CoA mutase family protein [Desulfobacterales bacterium]|nr:methylmalonyl-CoA mutase family protein [Desulfobacterales bacterium]
MNRITDRGGVLGAMETGYQRSKIQEESMDYETRKQQGKIPVVGVNTFRDSEAGGEPNESVHLARATEAEKQSQLKRLARFKKKNEKAAPAAIKRLQEAALSGENIFAQLLDTVRVCSLGQITQALFEVGGRYRRNM